MKPSVLSSGEGENNTFKISFADRILWETWQIYAPACKGTIRIFICTGKHRPKGIFHFLNKHQPNLGACRNSGSKTLRHTARFYFMLLFLGLENGRPGKWRLSQQNSRTVLQVLLMSVGSKLTYQMCREMGFCFLQIMENFSQVPTLLDGWQGWRVGSSIEFCDLQLMTSHPFL